MKTSFPWKGAILVFAAVFIAYLMAFHGIEHARHRKGPWECHFKTGSQGKPTITVFQPSLSISNVQLALPDVIALKTSVSEVVRFDRPKKPIPFGKVIYEDLTFLPGVVTFDLFGHEVELLPRILIINKQEIPWKSQSRVDLWATNKLPMPPKPAKGYE